MLDKVIFPQIWGKGCHFGVRIGRVSEFLQVAYTKLLDTC